MSIQSIAAATTAGLLMTTTAAAFQAPAAQAMSKAEYRQELRRQQRQIRYLERQNQNLRLDLGDPFNGYRYRPQSHDWNRPVPSYRVIERRQRIVRPRAGFSLFGGVDGGPGIYVDLN
jgi:hypothetical protein